MCKIFLFRFVLKIIHCESDILCKNTDHGYVGKKCDLGSWKLNIFVPQTRVAPPPPYTMVNGVYVDIPIIHVNIASRHLSKTKTSPTIVSENGKVKKKKMNVRRINHRKKKKRSHRDVSCDISFRDPISSRVIVSDNNNNDDNNIADRKVPTPPRSIHCTRADTAATTTTLRVRSTRASRARDRPRAQCPAKEWYPDTL